MFDRLANGWELMKASYRVLRQNTELLVFPIFSGAACLAVLATFAVPLFYSGAWTIENNARQAKQNPVAWAILFAFYFCNYFVIVFFNAALVACAIVSFGGGKPTLRDGIQAAAARLPQILGWSLVSATVGFLLKVVESRSERLGEIMAGLLGMAWSIATFFVVPVIVVEKAGPIEAVRRSTSILRRAWGEAFVANQGIGLIIGLLIVVACVPAAAGFALGSAVTIGIGIAVTVCLWIILGAVGSALNTILLGALYVFAAQGRVPDAFAGASLRSAFAPKQG